MIIAKKGEVVTSGSLWEALKDYARITACLTQDIPTDVIECLTALGLEGVLDDNEMIAELKKHPGFFKLLADAENIQTRSKAKRAAYEFLKSMEEEQT